MRLAAVTKAVIDYCHRHGHVITTAQARQCGANSRQLAALAGTGLLLRAHPGVYVLAGAPRDHALALRTAMAALRASDSGQVFAASHVSAAWLQGVIDKPPPEVHITTTTSYQRTLPGVTLHRTRSPLERRPYQGIPCTLPARTLVDLAAVTGPARLADAVDRALSTAIVRIRDLEAEIDRGHRRGTDQLRRCLQDRGLIGAPTPSVLESRMARLITRYAVPITRSEMVAGPAGEYRIDYAAPQQRLAVELYGYAHHRSADQMAYDHARQRRLTLEGWTVLVFTWKDVTSAPERVVRDIMDAAKRAKPA